MTRVNRSANCSNSPKNKMAEDIAVALERRDVDFLAKLLDGEATWQQAGSAVATAEAILNHLGGEDKPTSLTIDQVVTHGRAGAVNGTTRRGTLERRFCHVFEFTSAKCDRILRIESYGD